MSRTITQRELRNGSGEITRSLDQGESFIVTRNGTPVGELTPLRRHRFVSTDTVVAMFRHAPSIDAHRFRDDLERLDPSLLPIESAVSASTMAELAASPFRSAARRYPVSRAGERLTRFHVPARGDSPDHGVALE